jgi:hypothetical protein
MLQRAQAEQVTWLQTVRDLSPPLTDRSALQLCQGLGEGLLQALTRRRLPTVGPSQQPDDSPTKWACGPKGNAQDPGHRPWQGIRWRSAVGPSRHWVGLETATPVALEMCGHLHASRAAASWGLSGAAPGGRGKLRGAGPSSGGR